LLKALIWSTPVHVCIVNFARSASTRVRVVILSLIQLKTISNATSGICLSHNPLRRHFEALANWISIEGYSTAVSRRGNHNFLFLRLWSLLPLLLLGGCTATTWHATSLSVGQPLELLTLPNSNVHLKKYYTTLQRFERG